MLLVALKDRLGINESGKDSILARCIIGATEITTKLGGNDQMILSIAALLYQRRMACV